MRPFFGADFTFFGAEISLDFLTRAHPWSHMDPQKSNFPWISVPKNAVFGHLKALPKGVYPRIPAERRKRRRGEAPEPFPPFGRDRF